MKFSKLYFATNTILTGICTISCTACMDENDQRCAVSSFVGISKRSFCLWDEMEENWFVERLSYLGFVLR
jgi:hypothetical protein